MKKICYLFIPVVAIVITTVFSCGRSAGGNKQIEIIRASNNSLIKKGAYLVMISGCNDCHSPKRMDPRGPEIDTLSMLSGYQAQRPIPDFPEELIKTGAVVVNNDLTAAMGPWGTSFAANLTSDETGIGNWTEEQFKNALTHGWFKGLKNTRPIMPPMPWQNFKNMKDEDIKAIFAYLKSTKPVKNIVPAFIPAKI
ncbi:c-type cytochrome [Mucilaginibacter gynuensis]|uniref:C-type cytochrome n=1 Tax=Mucilaginibacter gynuensis TaxID=1302236 RepID=A0ABP8GH28_9SPHI